MSNTCRVTMLFIFIISSCFSVMAAEDNKWQGYAELLAKPGATRSLGQADLFVPLMQDNDSLMFFSLRGQTDDVDNDEFNVGLGFRQLYSGWILGSWGYFDRRNTNNGNTFSQGNIGFEVLSDTWDYRVNGYIPEPDKKRVSRLDTVEVIGSSIGIRLGQERALPGFDAEVGYKLPVFEDTRIYAGGFHFNADGFDNVSGPRARLEMRFHDLPFLGEDSRVMLGAEVTHDGVRDTQAFGLVQLRIPFGIRTGRKSRELTSLERRMTDPVVRDIDIISNPSLGDRIAARTSSGQVITGITTVDASGGDIATQVVNAGGDSIVVVDGAAGTVDTAGITMQPGQALTSGGMPFTLSFLTDEGNRLENITYTPRGTPATINGTGVNVITVAINNRTVNKANVIQNLTITGGTGDGITTADADAPLTGNLISDRANVRLINSTIRGVGENGIELDDSSTLTVINSTIEDTGAVGIAVDDLNTVNISGNSVIRNTVGQGVKISSENNVTIDGLSFSETAREALTFDNRNTNVTVSNVTFNDVGTGGQEAIQLLADNNITFNNITIDTTGNDGIRTTNGNTLIFNTLNITNTTGQGIEFDNNNNITLANATINNTTSDGIEAANSNTFGITNSKIGNIAAIGGRGLDFFDDNIVTLTNTSINNTSDDGIRFNDGNIAILTGLTLSNATMEGIDLDGTNGNNEISIIDSTINTTGSYGIHVADAPDFANAHQLDLSSVTITDAGDRGIFVENFNKGTFNDVTVDSSAVRGIQFDNDNSFTLTDVTIQNVTANEGLKVFDRNVLVITNLNVSGINSRGLDFRDGNDIELNNSTISNVTGSAVTIRDDNILSGTGNTVVAPADGGACNVGTGNTGNFAFTDIIGGGAGTCPP